jgi:hypothetical protein
MGNLNVLLMHFSSTVTEFIIKKYRTLLGILYNMSYPLGMMLLPLIALYIEEWRMLQLALSVPTVILIVHIWYVTTGSNLK